MVIISILYISSFYPSSKEPYRGHFIEKQAKLLGEELNEKVIILKPLISRRAYKKRILHERYNDIDIYSIYYPNFLQYFTLLNSSNNAYKYFKKEIQQILNTDRPKITISNDLFASLRIGNIISENYSSIHYSIVHGENTQVLRRNPFLKKAISKELVSCNNVIAVSNKIKSYISCNFNYHGEIAVNGNGVAKEIIEKYANCNFSKNDLLTITSIGNLNFNKGIDIVLDALKEIDIPFVYNIIGDGPYKNELLRMISKYNLEEKIVFTGNIANEMVFEYLEKSHFFILPSRNEAFGIVYLEAMITGNICIGTKGQGCEDFISNKENGFLVNNTSEIKNIILNYYNSDKKNTICRKAREKAKEYNWNKNVQNIIDLLRNDPLFKNYSSKKNHLN
ncbi:glycosyltransferase family 4 protein [Cytobacillus oceanisediminis]|uniref:glycosyltransferase family 4 protein n=1 Tax=Cytobacillus oceanisediminis TaxID=665099 RepID=UPI001D158A99|nr:glycosyltransferase family 4 protein [Cytobacillus oceanisediminis]MCC3648464.1 glycosyltransferase family 4 protein [Cytobacillus oceanisediminis]